MLLNEKLKRIIGALLCTLILLTPLTACTSKSTGGTSSTTATATAATGAKEPPLKVSIMTTGFTNEPVQEDIKSAVEEYTNAKIELLLVPDSSYNDKMNVTMASGDIPMIMLAKSKLASVINAVRSNAFWEVGPYLKDYTNFSKAKPIVLNNISIDGKVFGIYRDRLLGRMGIIYRKDWLDNIGMKDVKTVDDFYQMLKGFTQKDPDKNGKDDTFGMAVTKYKGPFDIMLTWFGAPNGWGEDKDGKLTPAFMTSEYMDCMKFWKKMFDEKLINPDFAVLDSAKWNDLMVNGKAGVIVDVADRSNQVVTANAKANITQDIDVIGAVSGPKGLKNLPTSGYNGFYLISKNSVKTEGDLKKVLGFMDKLNDKKAQDLIQNGIEGKHYKLEGDVVIPQTKLNLSGNGVNDFVQILTFIPEKRYYNIKETALVKKVNEIYISNEKIVVGNPGEPLISTTYSTKGAQLDNIIEDARVKFIVGQIDEPGFKAAIDLWNKSGGTEYVKEMNDEYTKVKKK